MKNYDPANEMLYSLLDKALDTAMLEGKFLFSMDGYLKGHEYTRRQTTELLDSSTFGEIKSTIEELDGYLHGDKMLKEAYGHVTKANARKILKYLMKLRDEALSYHETRKPGRPKGAKNKKKRTK